MKEMFDKMKEFWNNKDSSWIECSKEMFLEQLFSVLPLKIFRESFMSGECWDIDDKGEIYSVFVCIDVDKHYCKYSYTFDWDVSKYREEIIKQFDL